MLVQLLKIRGCVVIGVVGRPHKVESCRALGCDCVIDKSSEDLWAAAAAFGATVPRHHGESGQARGAERAMFDCVFDANGVATLADGFERLAPGGRPVVQRLHSIC